MNQIILAAIETIGKEIVISEFPKWIEHLQKIEEQITIKGLGSELHLLECQGTKKLLQLILSECQTPTTQP
jgi:hypothetical protein